MPFGFQFEKDAIINFLKTVDYPASKQKILDLAKDHELPLQVISMLQRLPEDHEFSSPDEVNHELTAKTQ